MKAPDKIYNPLYNVEYIRKDAVLELLQKMNKELDGEPKAVFRSFELQEVYRRIKEL